MRSCLRSAQRDFLSAALRAVWALHAALTFAAPASLFAQEPQGAAVEAWVQRRGIVVSNSTDLAFQVMADAAGNVIVAGNTDDGTSGGDMLTIKYSGIDGSVIWQKRYDGPAHASDEARGMALDVRGDVVVVGLSSSERSNDYYIAKYAGGDGALLWEQRSGAPPDTFPPQAMALDTAGNVVLTGTDTNRNYQILKFSTTNGALLWEIRGPRGSPRASMVDPSGNVTVIGSVLGSNGTPTAYAAKYNGVNGTLLWERREVEFDALVVNAQGNVVVAGSRQNHYSITTYATADGSLLWQRGGPEGAAEAVALDISGDIVVTGESADGTNINFYTAKYAAADGGLKWERRYNEPRNHWDSHTALAIDNKGDVLLTGTAGKVTTNFLSEIFYVAKYAAADGALLWEKRGPSGVSRAIAVDQAGDVLTTGYSWNGSSYDFYTAKTSGRDGTLVWESRYNNLANRDEYPLSVGIDTNDNVVVTGSTVWGQYTTKFAAADGTLLWEQRAPPGERAKTLLVDRWGDVVLTGIFIPSNNLYYAVKYSGADGFVAWRRYGPGGIPAGGALDAEGNVIVSGDLGGTNHVSYTAKYASASGQLLWEKRGAKIEDYVIAVVADVAGNVVVTGSSSSNGKPEYFATKYNVADGAVLWERRYPRSHNAFPAALSVDPAGNVLVTGCVSNDYYTAKLAAADGMLLWEKRYNGAENGYDAASAISSDSSGNAVVNGVSCNGTNCHYYTAKLAAADGALLWERHGPFSPREHVGNGLALDADGNAVITANSYRETNLDYYTAKYAAADGTVVWERRYDSSIHQNDFVAYSRPIAVGRNGVVAVTGYSDSNPGPLHAYDFATVVYRDKLLPLAIEIIAEGVRIRLTAISNGSYEVQRAGALVGSWSTIATVPATSGKTIDYVDTTQPTGAVFYRVRHSLPLGR